MKSRKRIPWVVGAVGAGLFLAPYLVLTVIAVPPPLLFTSAVSDWAHALMTFMLPISAAILWRGHAFGRAAVEGSARIWRPPLTEDGSETSQRLDLGVPPYNRLTLALVPHTVTADGVSPVRLHIYFDDTGRRPPPASALAITTSLAPVRPVEHVRGPLYLAEYTAPPGTPDGEASFLARLRRDRSSSRCGARDAVLAMRTVPSTGPFVRFTTIDGATMGDLVGMDPLVTFEIEVQAPSWIAIDRVELIANGEVFRTWDSESEGWSEGVVRFQTTTSVTPQDDTWYAVQVEGDTEMAPVYPGLYPWAITSPIFVDANGNGRFDPPW